MFREFTQIRGLFKYLVLYTLRDEALHGYGIIQRMSELFNNEYSPSPGIIYPTLQYLEDSDLVRSEKRGRKTVYFITGKGMRELKENMSRIEEFINMFRMRRRIIQELGGHELLKVAKDLMVYYPILSDEKKRLIREAAKEFRMKVEKILRGD